MARKYTPAKPPPIDWVWDPRTDSYLAGTRELGAAVTLDAFGWAWTVTCPDDSGQPHKCSGNGYYLSHTPAQYAAAQKFFELTGKDLR